MKILLSAYACEPHSGSEPGVGWNLANLIAQEHEVWVLTSHCHRSAIDAELARHPNPRLHPIYCDPWGWVYNWKTGGRGLQADVYMHYYLWQIHAYWQARPLHRTIGFDIVHHATYGRYPSPSFLALLPVPFVWGPVGGGESAPHTFWRDFQGADRRFEWIREFSRTISEFDPFVRLTARRSKLALACTTETADRLTKVGAANIKMLSGQTGVTQAEYDQLQPLHGQRDASQRPVRFLSLGRILHWKGFHLGIQAFAAANLPNAEYWVVGDGGYRTTLEALVEKLGIADRVKFLGSVSRSAALQIMGDCDVLVHPSLHDFSPTVCVEAMAAGLPVICLQLGGPGMQITDETGLRIAAPNPATAIDGMATAMQRLTQEPQLRQQMGTAGQQRVQAHYRWEDRGPLFNEIYQQALAMTIATAPLDPSCVKNQ
jgi:glycosyltransferase involved in cell wall biosynthesis